MPWLSRRIRIRKRCRSEIGSRHGYFSRNSPDIDDDDNSTDEPSSSSGSDSNIRAVGFVSDSTLESVIELPERTEQELEDMWYSDEDYRNHKKDCARTIVRLSRCKPNSNTTGRPAINEDEFCARGLESMSKDAKMLRNHRYDYSVQVVLKAQEETRRQGMKKAATDDDDEIVRQVYAEATRKSVEIARYQGEQDAMSTQIQ